MEKKHQSVSGTSEENVYRKRRHSYSEAMADENTIESNDLQLAEHCHSRISLGTNSSLRRKLRSRDNSSLESVTWSSMSFDSKRELIRTPSADTNRSSSEFELSEVLRSYPDLDSKLIRCKCYVVTNNKCQCRYRYQCCHCQRRRISSISRRESFGSLRRKGSSYSVSTCQSFLPPSSVRNSSIGSVYRIGYYNRGDSSSDQNERIVNKELPIQRRYSDQTHFVRPCQIEYADRRRYSEQTPRDNIVECSSASRCNNHLRSRLSSRFLAKAGQKRSSLSFKPTTSYDDVPVKEEEEEEERKEKEKEHDETDYEKDGNDSGISSVPDNRRKSKATTSAPTVNPKMFKRRFSEQLILEGGLSGLPDFDTLVRPEQDDIAEDDEESLTGINARKRLTLKKHYYPEGGWGRTIILVGVLVQLLSHGLQLAAGVILTPMINHFKRDVRDAGWLGAMSTGVALLVSPVTIAFCRRKSTRVTAVLGGLVTALGCLFTSFASQFHQLFFSYGTMVGIGVSMTRDCSTLMVAQYFKRKRELVEIFIVSGSGLGIAVMSAFIKGTISKIGWRLGLQAVTGVVFLTFILGTFYRSASLYHPQRRAILHLKNQKRKIKDKNKTDDRPPFFDFSTLKSKTVRILLVSTGISAFGINTPIFYLAHQAEEEGLGDTVVLLQAYLGLAWTLGCVAFGLLVVHRNVECRIARQYLTQAAVFVCGLCILALTAVQGNYHGYVMFTWIYGIFCGGYHYSLKMYTYERVRARNFARTWGFVQCSQAIPIAIGVPISGYINDGCGGKAGYYFSSTCVLVGSFTLFFIDLHRRNLSKHKHTRANGSKHLCVLGNCPQQRRPSFSHEQENDGTHVAAAGAAAAALVLGAELGPTPGDMIDALGAEKPELTCISEEGIADMDLPDNLLEDLDYIGDCITSCNKVENYLMLSEFENNLIAEMPIIMGRRGRRWSLARSKAGQTTTATACSGQQQATSSTNAVAGNSPIQEEDRNDTNVKWHLGSQPTNTNSRTITVIDEAST